MPVELAFQGLGDGPPLVVLHGLFGSGTNWRTVARALAARHRVLLVDLRNHGASPHDALMDYPAMAADLRALLDREGLDSPVLLGHSMGGKVVMRLALESPERVARAVVVDIAPRPSGHDHHALVGRLAILDTGGIERRADADAELAADIPDPGLRGFLLQNLVRDEAGWRWRINIAAIERNLDALVGWPDADGARYEGPALFVRGERSDYLTPEHEPLVRRTFPNAAFAMVPGAGHLVHVENPPGFLAAVDDFLLATGG